MTAAQWFIARRRILGDGAWVAFGQIGSALGALAGTRLLTEFLPPRVFGEVVLLLGVATLGYGLAGGPFMQAVLRLYPDCARAGSLGQLRGAVRKLLVRSGGLLGALWIAGWFIYSRLTGEGLWLGLLLVPLLALDMARSLEVGLFNAARRQRPMALWTAIEAWARPVFAVAVVMLAGASAESVLSGFIAASLATLMLFFLTAQREGMNSAGLDSSAAQANLRREIWRYALPLLPLGLIGWASSLADRYMIGGMLGIEYAGLYAAAYGIASRPAISFCGGIETTLRPLYFQAISSGDQAAARRAFRVWFGLVTTLALAIFLFFFLFSDVVAQWFLGAQYRAGASLMPWIAAGYGLSAVSQVFAGVAYAHGHTRDVLMIQVTGAIASVLVGFVGVYLYGIDGAAMAVPLALGLQLLVAMVLAKGTAK